MKINTKLKSFLMIDKLIDIDSEKIVSEKKFINKDYFLLLEAIAQTCALHSRFLVDFKKHAFLLKISKVKFSKKKINSNFRIVAKKKISTQNSFGYEVKVYSEEKEINSAEVIVSTVDYDNEFNKNKLKERYMKVFECLKEN